MSNIANTSVPDTTAAVGRMASLRDFWFYFSVNRGAVIGLWVFVVIIALAILAPLIAPHDPIHQYRDFMKVPPVWQAGGKAEFLLGTDELGRDILSRLLYGAQYSLLVGFVIVAISMCIGIVVGAIAGFFGGAVDAAFMRVMDIMLSFPSLLLALVLVAILGPGLINAIIAIGIFNIPVFARVARAGALAIWPREFILAARAAGKGKTLITVEHIVPNIANQLLVQGTIQFALGILAESGLSYLGLGAQPPMPSWGRMLFDAQTRMTVAPWMAIFPGMAIVVTVLALNLLGDGIADMLDPRSRRRR